MPPKVSCLCPTFGRAPDYLWLLAEAVQSFLVQDYNNAELIILDNSHQTLHWQGDPRVRVINDDRGCETLGDKYNRMVEHASGELLCPWEDDDISLSWRITMSVTRLADWDYWNPQRWWLWQDGSMRNDRWRHGVGHNCAIFRKSAWETVGGYPGISGPQDRIMDTRLRQQVHCAPRGDMPLQTWFYIHRQGVSPIHLSAHRPHGQRAYEAVMEGRRESGDVWVPHFWLRDYEQVTKRTLTTSLY